MRRQAISYIASPYRFAIADLRCSSAEMSKLGARLDPTEQAVPRIGFIALIFCEMNPTVLPDGSAAIPTPPA